MKLFYILVFLMLVGCGGENKESNVQSPGTEKTPKTETLETGAAILQDKTPISKINMYLDGFHFYNGDMSMQMEAHHYCSKLNEDITQCIMYDGNGEDAKIMGVEYIVSEKIFTQLPEEEKKMWHSHSYEVKSGALIAPGIPDSAEHALMEQIKSTYGKIFHTWHTDQKLELPIGIPQLMMGFTKDGQLKDSLVKERDKRFVISTSEKKRKRKDIDSPQVQPGADAWEKGDVVQLGIERGKKKREHH